jgi:hypothetical protein
MTEHEHYVGVTFPHDAYPTSLHALVAYEDMDLLPEGLTCDLVVGDRVMEGATVIWTEPPEADE